MSIPEQPHERNDAPAEAGRDGTAGVSPSPGQTTAVASRADRSPAGRSGEGRAGEDGETPTPVGRLAATVERLRREVRAAQAEAEGRALVELAKGILVERLGCGPAEAARQLTELARQAGVTPLEFAVEVINQAARDRVSEVTDAFIATVSGVDDGPADGLGEGLGEDSAAVRLRAAESAALAAHDTQAVADSLLQHALGPLGAVAVAIWAAGAGHVHRDGLRRLRAGGALALRLARARTGARR
ncbi:ANTAR domain-containing protein, partial [Streptomyces sp. NPDC001856]|uniref:ANTAR domain-containing protein n=1 Tax=Streptomyces sp. NPDC001856 TaxID=3154399 RepID=UPI00331CAB3C